MRGYLHLVFVVGSSHYSTVDQELPARTHMGSNPINLGESLDLSGIHLWKRRDISKEAQR